ncbi:hypothetical protein CIB48_g6363 [Xylaria polymorpha]|nr:hypothetical protein CIB48_g6363 [Xylaria polymorpha]
MENPQEHDFCINCDKQTTLVCNRCKSACYCSLECQQTDLPIHGLLCSDFANFEVTARPTGDHIQAILFPEDQEKPKIIWLNCGLIDPDEDDANSRGRSPNMEPFLNPRFTIRRSFVKNNLILARELSGTICICYCDSIIDSHSITNKSIEHITATRLGQYFDWTGAVIAYGKIGRSSSPGNYKDLDMNDFRHITDYLFSCGFNLALPTPPCSLPKVKAVRINCVDGREALNRPLFEQVELSANDPIFTVHDTSDILDRIGIPVFTQRCTPPQAGYISSYHVVHAMSLHLSCDPKAADWGFVARRWKHMPRSAIMVRQDKKPLSLLHAEALCGYCFDVFCLMGLSSRVCVRDEYITKEFVMSILISRPFFTIYRNKLIFEKVIKNEEVDDMSCPYGV